MERNIAIVRFPEAAVCIPDAPVWGIEYYTVPANPPGRYRDLLLYLDREDRGRASRRWNRAAVKAALRALDE